MKIAIGSDHAGYGLKAKLTAYLNSKNHSVCNFGTNSPDSVDYPDFAHPVAEAVENKEVRFGVLICGSANGVAMTANKHQKIRAAIAWNRQLSKLARQHNNANILCIPARFVTPQMATMMVKDFIETKFEGGRHKRRVGKISC